MKVFISWSGNLSKSVGEVLHKYLPTILQGVNVFLSAHDIEAGSKWAQTLSDEMESTNFGILCLTPSNLESRWLLFEAGALSKLSGSAVCGLLTHNLKPTDIESPLSQFQNKRFNKSDIKSLLSDINKKRSKPLGGEQLSLLFDTFWPKIDDEYNKALSTNENSGQTIRTRTEKELLEEILYKVRWIENQTIFNKSSMAVDMEQLFDMPVNFNTVAEYCKRRFPHMETSPRWEDRLLQDLNTQKYPYIRDIDNAVSNAMPAMKAYAKEAPNMFKSSTSYITKALGFTDKEFRDVHPWANITRQAFEKYSKLVTNL